MGFWGTLVVCKSAVPLIDVSAISERDEGLVWHQDRESGWQVGQYMSQDLFRDCKALLVELAAETQAPALAGFVLDSDAVELAGFSVENGYWKACLAREAMRNYCEDADLDFDVEFPMADAAPRDAAAWAAAAGTTPDIEALDTVFSADQADGHAEDLFFELLGFLGI